MTAASPRFHISSPHCWAPFFSAPIIVAREMPIVPSNASALPISPVASMSYSAYRSAAPNPTSASSGSSHQWRR